jgi:integrase
VQVPRKRSAPIVPLDIDEARRLLDETRGDRLHALWAVAIGVGLRKGEALGLGWHAVDLDAGLLRVERTLQRINGSLRLDESKTERSKRTVRLPAVCVAALRKHAERQADERAAAHYWADTGLVLTTQLGTAIDPRNVNRWLAELCDRAGVRSIRPHDLRHTCASLLLAQGVPARVVMDILGHSQIAVTMDIYSHVVPAMQDDAAGRMDDALG